MSSQALPAPFTHPYCVWSENRLGNYGNLELGLPGTQPFLPPEGNPGPQPLPAPGSLEHLIQAVRETDDLVLGPFVGFELADGPL